MSEWTGEENCGDGERVSVRKVRDLDNTAKDRNYGCVLVALRQVDTWIGSSKIHILYP